MADTVVELCWANLKTTLEGVTRANGYNTDIEQVTRGEIEWRKISRFPCVMIVPGREVVVTRFIGAKVLRTAPFTLGLFMRSNAVDVHKKMEVLAADIKKALAVDFTRAGNARDTRETGLNPDYIVPGQEISVMELEYEMDYQTSATDPESQ